MFYTHPWRHMGLFAPSLFPVHPQPSGPARSIRAEISARMLALALGAAALSRAGAGPALRSQRGCSALALRLAALGRAGAGPR